jgi:hypothetical protein
MSEPLPEETPQARPRSPLFGRPRGPNWSAKECDTLVDMAASGKSDAEIATVLTRRTATTIGYKRRDLAARIRTQAGIDHAPATDMDLPSPGQGDESAGGPRVVSAPFSRDASLTAPEEPALGEPPAPLFGEGQSWRADKYSLGRATPIAVERTRAMSKANGHITPRAVSIALSDKDRCQWPLWDDKPDGRYCGKKRCGPMSYCKDHTARAYRKAGEVAA